MANTITEIGKALTVYITLPIIAIALLLLLGMCNQGNKTKRGVTTKKEVPPKGRRFAPHNSRKFGSRDSEDEL